MASTPTAQAQATAAGMPAPLRGLVSPRLTLDDHDNTAAADAEPSIDSPSVTAPPPLPVERQFTSPIRHHKRSPSQHREVKETLDARIEYANDEMDGRTHHRVNQYVLIEEIGRGSYGAVHLARDHNGNDYAIKEFSKVRLRKQMQSNILRQGPRAQNGLRFLSQVGRQGTLSPKIGGPEVTGHDALYLIREEIAVMKKLNHPNLVQLIEVLDDSEEDSLFMVVEMCKKGVIMKIGLGEQADPYSEESCRCWFRDLILGVEYLHAQGVIHRDIKPDNLLLSDDLVLKIVDFGVSEMFEKPDNMRTAKSAGSPAFLPPELCGRHSHVSGSAADIWSMGVTLYCLRYGRLPFHEEGMLAMYEAIKTEAPPIPDDEEPDFKDLMGRLLEKDPQKRITMPELREHDWVTRRGADRLLPVEENCAHLIEPPNELELSHAFTRKVNHLLCMMKAIHRFKMILVKKRSSTPRPEQDPFIAEKDQEMEIEALISQRRQMLEETDGDEGDKGHAHDVSDRGPLFLGIGLGGRDDFNMDEPSNDVVADSPTAVDFSVYDAAYQEALEKGSRAFSAAGNRTVYRTRFVSEAECDTGDEQASTKGQPPSLADMVSKVGINKE